MTEYAEEEWKAGADFGKTQGNHATLTRILLRETPAQIDFSAANAEIRAKIPELRKYFSCQYIPFRVHISKRR